jgi:hypothetical protein
MPQLNWADRDYEVGYDALLDHSDPETPTLFNAKETLQLILPEGLPVFGLHWIGAVMIAPILVFISILALLPIIIITGSHATWINGIVTTGMCLILLWGFSFVLKLMILNRDIFPRRYFSFFGSDGIAVRFSRLHFPMQNPKMELAWNEIKSLHIVRKFFLPGLLVANPIIVFIEAQAEGDRKISIPISPKENNVQFLVREIEKRSGKSFS